MLRGISEVDMSTTLLGETVSMPICVSPIGYQKLAHKDGERATAIGEMQHFSKLDALSGVNSGYLTFWDP